MTDLDDASVNNGIIKKINYAKKLISEKGIKGFLLSFGDFLRYHLRDKWHFVYLEWKLEKPAISFPRQDALIVRQATADDLNKIKLDIFPFLIGELEYDKRYFQYLDHQRIKCFVAEKDNRLVHYSWVFVSAIQSPLAKTPFDSKKLKSTDVYIGPIFTSPSFRGFIYPYVLGAIQQFLIENTSAERVIVLVQGLNPATVSFYKRLGFQEII